MFDDHARAMLEASGSYWSAGWPAGRKEICLVDNASMRPVSDEVRRRWPEVRLIASERNLGFGGGCNLALGDLESVDLVALVNNDADVPPDWLKPLREEIQRGD